ncbi:hypothetical protein RDWZM_007711 [Blomia tropicalis]|uniref:Uncharacterized protein n=1 Tax=Blomia tropicalis TaxID=40697 RepID=A0A9Q0M000_BLOTA|nr:hypothetical protein RDWZM_007711 [Blomia tropicalis]
MDTIHISDSDQDVDSLDGSFDNDSLIDINEVPESPLDNENDSLNSDTESYENDLSNLFSNLSSKPAKELPEIVMIKGKTSPQNEQILDIRHIVEKQSNLNGTKFSEMKFKDFKKVKQAIERENCSERSFSNPKDYKKFNCQTSNRNKKETVLAKQMYELKKTIDLLNKKVDQLVPKKQPIKQYNFFIGRENSFVTNSEVIANQTIERKDNINFLDLTECDSIENSLIEINESYIEKVSKVPNKVEPKYLVSKAKNSISNVKFTCGTSSVDDYLSDDSLELPKSNSNSKVNSLNYKYKTGSINDFNMNVKKNTFNKIKEKANEAILKKDDHKQLLEFICKSCQNQYKDKELTEEQMKQAIHECSRHRNKPPEINSMFPVRSASTLKNRKPISIKKRTPITSHRHARLRPLELYTEWKEGLESNANKDYVHSTQLDICK